MADSKRKPTPRSATPRKLKQHKQSASSASSRPKNPRLVGQTPSAISKKTRSFADVGKVFAAASSSAASWNPRRHPERSTLRKKHQRKQQLRLIALIVGALLVVATCGGVAFLALRSSSLFSIEQITVIPTEHVSETDLKNLMRIPEGTTLFTLDDTAVQAQLKQHPWVREVHIERSFPHDITIEIVEHQPQILAVMNASASAWYVSSDGTWIEPARMNVEQGKALSEVALAQAQEKHCLLVVDLPLTVNPESAAYVQDPELLAVRSYQQTFSQVFAAQIVSYSVPSVEGMSCMLNNGVQILLGQTEQIDKKEAIARQLLSEYPGQITYINVRNPSRNGVSFRKIDSKTLQPGSGTKTS